MRPLLVAALALLVLASSAHANTYDVTAFDDPAAGPCDAHCTLREAITQSQTSAGADQILLPAGTYVLSQGQLPQITEHLTVAGAGAERTRITGGVQSGPTVATRSGAFAVANPGRLALLRVTLAGNRVAVDDPASQTITVAGGAIVANGGAVLLYRSVLRENVLDAPSTVGGAAIGFNNADVRLVESSIEDNRTNFQGTVVAGGVTGNGSGASLHALASAIIRNRQSQGAAASSVLAAGGAALNGTEDIRFENSTVSGNEAAGGTATRAGGVDLNGTDAEIVHSTLAGNSASGAGATQAGNLRMSGGDKFRLLGTIIAGGSSPVAANCIGGPTTSRGGNVENTNECGLGAGDKPSTDPQLGPLAANGGLTLTRAIAPTSPAANAAAAGTCPETDQRGTARPQGSGCDAGAFEVGNPAPPPPVVAPVNTQRPSIAGTVREGLDVTCAPGAWSGEPTFAFAWLRDGAPIAGPSSPTYRVTRTDAGRALECQVTATNAGGSVLSESAPRVAVRACIVPKLNKATLATARKRLKSAGCGLGTVTLRASSSVARGRVISSSPKAATNRAAGTKVKLVVSRGRR